MPSCTLKMSLINPIAVECVFWAEDNCWKGVCEDLSIVVRGRDFEECKEHMETVLKTYVGPSFEDTAKPRNSDAALACLRVVRSGVRKKSATLPR